MLQLQTEMFGGVLWKHMPKGSIFYNLILSSPLVVGVTRDEEIELRFTHPLGVWLHCLTDVRRKFATVS